MTISKTSTRQLRTAGTASMWLAGWAAVDVLATWLGAGRTLTGFHTAMIIVAVVFFTAGISSWLMVRHHARRAIHTESSINPVAGRSTA